MSKTQNLNIRSNKKFDITNKHTQFSEAKVYVMYHGENRNNSFISKEDVDKSLNSMYNIPIVGEFLEKEEESEDSNFGTHGGQLVIDDKGVKFIQTTRPVGVIPESAKVYWERVKDEKDIEREYLIVEGALLWNRYEEEVSTLKADNFGQSMEVEVTDGWFDDDSGLYHITDFDFSAFCILGIEGRKGGHVEPAFEDAKIITYSKDSFKEEFKEMKEDLISFYNKEEEENEVAEENKDKVNEEEELENKENKDDKVEPEVVQTETEGINGNVVDDKEEAEKNQGTAGDTDGGTTDTTADADVVANTPSDAEVTADANTDTEAYAKLKEERDSLAEKVKELTEFKENVEKEQHESSAQELFDKFGLTEEDTKDIDVHKYTVDEIEDKCYAILGRKVATEKKEFSLDDYSSSQTNKVNLSQASQQTEKDGYGGLIEKNLRKN